MARTGRRWTSCSRPTTSITIRTTLISHQPTGPHGFRQRVEGYRSVLSNFDLRVEQQIAEGDMVETHWSLRGIHAGALEGVDPTGKPVHVDGQLLSRILEGKFVEEWVHWDTLGLLRQIGAMPAPTT
jgi:predicted ester cyclase